jgi:MFS family permease
MPHGYWPLWSAALLFFAAFYSLLVLVPAHLSGLGFLPGQTAFIVGTFGTAAFIARPLAGALADIWGHGKLMVGGSAALALGTISMGFSADPYVLFGLRLLQSGGYAAFTTAATAGLAALLPPQRRTQGMAFFGISANVAMTAAPGLVAFSAPLLATDTQLSLCGIFAIAAGVLGLSVSRRDRYNSAPFQYSNSFIIPSPLRRPMALAACFGMGFGAFLLFLPLLAGHRDIPVGPLYTLYGASIIISRLCLGPLLSKLPQRLALAGGFLALTLGLGFFSYASGYSGFIGGTVCLALAGAVLHPLLLAMHADRSSQQTLGRGSAVFYLGFDAGIGLGGWLPALLVETYGFGAAYTLSGIFAIAGIVLSLSLGPHGDSTGPPTAKA